MRNTKTKHLLVLSIWFALPGCLQVSVVGSSPTSSSATTTTTTTTVSNSDGVPSTGHRIFVSSRSYSGNLGGLAGADAECADMAANAGLTRTYVALLSTSTVDAIDRVSWGGDIYIIDAGGDAHNLGAPDNFYSYANTAMDTPIKFNETTAADGGNMIFTGTLGDGSSSGANCNDWTSSAAINATVGTTDAADYTAIEDGTAPYCDDTDKRILCVSQ